MAEDYLFYDEEVDHFTIHNGKEKIVFNIDTGLALLSFNENKQLVGLELMGAMKNFHLSKTILENVKECKVEWRYDPSTKILMITIQLKSPQSPIICAYENFNLGSSPLQNAFACSV